MDKQASTMPHAMEGGGYYNKNSALQASIAAYLDGMLKKAVADIPVGDEILTIADYGASQGRNSLAPMRTAVDSLRRRAGDDRAALVFHTDLPTNDFTTLFDTLSHDPASYLAGADGISVAAVGRSFYGVILPPDLIHLGWSSAAVNWLSRPVAPPDHTQDLSQDHTLHHPYAYLSPVPAIRADVADQAARDWVQFLSCRAVELRRGGKLVVSIWGRYGEGRSFERGLDLLHQAMQDLVAAGEACAEDVRRVEIPVYPRSLAEARAPFADPAIARRLRLDHIEPMEVPDPFWPAFQVTGDAGQFGRSWAATMRAFSGPSVTAALGVALADRIFARIADRVAADPQPFVLEITLAIATKIA